MKLIVAGAVGGITSVIVAVADGPFWGVTATGILAFLVLLGPVPGE